MAMTASSTLSLARLFAILTPVALLGGALASQYIGGLHPCEMCVWQRWPHVAAIFLALAAIVLRDRVAASVLFTGLAAIAIGISGGIGAFHAGVEYHWWEGITACSTAASGGSPAEMLDAIMAAPLTRCDTAPWSLLGISLAGYNALASLGAAAVIALLLVRLTRMTRGALT